MEKFSRKIYQNNTIRFPCIHSLSRSSCPITARTRARPISPASHDDDDDDDTTMWRLLTNANLHSTYARVHTPYTLLGCCIWWNVQNRSLSVWQRTVVGDDGNPANCIWWVCGGGGCGCCLLLLPPLGDQQPSKVTLVPRHSFPGLGQTCRWGCPRATRVRWNVSRW